MIETLKNYSPDQLIERIICHENFILEKEKTIVEKEKIIGSKDREIEYLKHQVHLFQKALFGPKKETHQVVVPPQQFQIPFEDKLDLDLPQDEEKQSITYQRRKGKKKRTDYSKLELPPDLPIEEIVLEPPDKTEDMIKIKEEVTELLAITPQKFYIKKIIRPLYARPNQEGVVIAPLPSRAIPDGKVDVSFLVTLLLDKYVYHLPLYRQQKKYEQLGVKLCDSTLGDWTAKSIQLLGHLYPALRERIRQSNYLQVDETTMRVLDKQKKGTTHLGYYWVYNDIENGLVLFDYHPSRGQAVPQNFLKDFHGIIQTDGYSAYDTLPGKNKNITLAGCMAHARRYFFEAQDNQREKATWMLDKIQALYEIEKTARELNFTHAQRLQLRNEKSISILNEMDVWLNVNMGEVIPQSPIGKAISYMKARWSKLLLFAKDGKLEIDNNRVENAIRPVALGRKNYLFAGSHEAAQRGAIMYSFTACCKKNGINEYRWFEEVLDKIPETKFSELYKLLPTKDYGKFSTG